MGYDVEKGKERIVGKKEDPITCGFCLIECV
jgi:hypothetical protein